MNNYKVVVFTGNESKVEYIKADSFEYLDNDFVFYLDEEVQFVVKTTNLVYFSLE